MTYENSKRLYAHFKETNQKDRATALLQKYPDFEEKEVKEEPTKETSKKKKKINTSKSS